jgi:hypothetical protein
LRESTFRRIRLGAWVDAVEEPWIAPELWGACVTEPPRGLEHVEVVLALDGSFSQDCTALVACTVAEAPHLEVVGLWENDTADTDYRVPVLKVENTIREACRRWRVLEIVYDPFRWTRTAQVLGDDRLPMIEFPQSRAAHDPGHHGAL